MNESRPQKKTSTAAAPVPACAGASSKPGAAGGLDPSTIAHAAEAIRDLSEALARVTKDRNLLTHKLSRELVEARRRDRPALKVIRELDLPGPPPGVDMPCEFSIYRGIYVWWDINHDMRVLDFLDAMPEPVRGRLLAIHQDDGIVHFVWDGPVPVGYEENELTNEPVEGCCWAINTSVGLLKDRAVTPDDGED